jgi:hypothetical protein
LNSNNTRIFFGAPNSCTVTNKRPYSKDFHIGDNTIEIVTKYNYLGLVITEFLDYNVMAKAVAMSASRALGLLIAKCKLNGGFIFNTYTILYGSLLWSIISYGAAIWGTKEYSCINAI